MSYALCDDRRTLLWFANQRAVEYHPTLVRAGRPGQPDFVVLDLDPPPGTDFGLVPVLPCSCAGRWPTAAWRARSRPADPRACTSSCRWLRAKTAEDAQRRRPGRSRPGLSALDPALATTAFIKEDREGKVFLDATRAGGATVVAAYSPRVRPGTPVSFPVGWDDLAAVTPAGLHHAQRDLALLAGTSWAD